MKTCLATAVRKSGPPSQHWLVGSRRDPTPRRRVRALLLLCAALSLGESGVSGAAGQRQGGSQEDGYAPQRVEMVAQQIQKRGVADARVLDAMRRVPRHQFVPAALRPLAYTDRPLPIGSGQTISQPFIVAFMTEALGVARTHRVLEVGTGSGYQAAVLAHLAREVYTIEIVTELAKQAAATLAELRYDNVRVREGDGYAGWLAHAPFDRIMVTAAPEQIPQPLIDQLVAGGRMVIPVGGAEQWLIVVEKSSSGVIQRRTIPVRFVPFTRGGAR